MPQENAPENAQPVLPKDQADAFYNMAQNSQSRYACDKTLLYRMGGLLTLFGSTIGGGFLGGVTLFPEKTAEYTQQVTLSMERDIQTAQANEAKYGADHKVPLGTAKDGSGKKIYTTFGDVAKDKEEKLAEFKAQGGVKGNLTGAGWGAAIGFIIGTTAFLKMFKAGQKVQEKESENYMLEQFRKTGNMATYETYYSPAARERAAAADLS